MDGLSGNDVVSRNLGLELKILHDGTTRIRSGSEPWSTFSYHAIAVLDLASEPIGLADLLTRSSGRLEWLDGRATVYRMLEKGVLTTGMAQEQVIPGVARGFSSPSIHISMLDDKTRTQAFITAIQKQVEPDSVVVDLGTGTGILAMAAALAGAGKTIAIEPGEMAGAAEADPARGASGDAVPGSGQFGRGCAG